MTGVLRRETTDTDADVQGEHQEEAEMGVMSPQTRACWQHQKLGASNGVHSFLEPSERT